jgi:CheY-like chemotaxis protein
VRANIVYIEDNLTNSELLRRTLEHLGHECITFQRARDALNYIPNNQPHLILTDLHMPEIDGYEFFALLRSIPVIEHVPIIAITANLGSESLRRCTQLGFDGVYGKPLFRKELMEILEKYLPAETQ